MELSGEDKRIQASFHELRIEDERFTPRFAAMWNRAHLSSARREIAFDFRIAAAVVIVCLSVFSLALLSRYWLRNPQLNYAVASGAVKSDASPTPIEKDQEVVRQDWRAPVVRKPELARFAQHRLTAKLAARRSTTSEGIALSRWQSPTTSFLRSPGDEVLRALPQLNQNLHEMESFLPNRTN